tara:strand:+ start:2584 stop:3132 length:549 start_codon:yes stop_codon:yes gene_type:complete
MILNIPIALTLSRLVLLPILILVFYLPYAWAPFVTAFIFAVAAFTDILDGYLARVLNQSTRFGEFLDPVVDKLTVISALVLLTELYSTWWFSLPALLMIGREIIISALREWMAELGKRGDVSVSWIGKVKTTMQMLAIMSLLWHPHPIVVNLGYVMLYFSVFLSVISMLIYLNSAWKDLAKA